MSDEITMDADSNGPNICDAQAENIVQRKRPLDIYVVNLKRAFDFSFLSHIFSDAVALRISMCLAEDFSKYTRRTALSRFYSFQDMFTWMTQQPEYVDIFRNCSAKELLMLDSAFGEIVNGWGEGQETHYKESLTTLGEKVNCLNRCFDALQSSGVFPHFQRYSMRKNYHSGQGRRKSLAELSTQHLKSSEILNSIKSRIQRLDPQIKEEELSGVLNGLLSSNSAETLVSDDALADAMLRKTAELLNLIRTLAESKFSHWMKVYDYGQLLLEKSEPFASEELSSASRLKGEARWRILDKVFPSNDLEQSLANFLKICIIRHGGVVPTANQFGDVPLFNKLMRRFGGKFYVAAMLNAHSDAVAAAILMYLVDSGANVAVALVIRTDFESPTDEEGWYEVRSVKNRAGYKPIINSFPEKDPSLGVTTIAALRKIRSSTERIRNSNQEFKDELLLHSYYGKPSVANNDFLQNRLNYFQRDAGIGNLRLLPGAIRVSFLIKHVLSGDGDVLSAQILADQAAGSGVNERYTLRWPVRVMYVKRIREFNESLEHQLIFGVEDAARLFGTNVTLAEKIMVHSERTGIGLSCKNSARITENIIDESKKCSKVGECLSCEMKLFHVDKENLIDVLLVHDFLTQNQPEMEAQLSAKWEALYLPLLAFATVVIEKVSRSRHAQLLKVAKAECTKLLSSGWTLPI